MKETLKRDGHEEEVRLSLVGMKIDLVYANECCGEFIDEYLIKKPMLNLTITKVTSSRTP